MPIEIRELVIKATIDDKGNQSGSSGGISSSVKQEIVESCVQQILEILKEKQER